MARNPFSWIPRRYELEPWYRHIFNTLSNLLTDPIAYALDVDRKRAGSRTAPVTFGRDFTFLPGLLLLFLAWPIHGVARLVDWTAMRDKDEGYKVWTAEDDDGDDDDDEDEDEDEDEESKPVLYRKPATTEGKPGDRCSGEAQSDPTNRTGFRLEP